MPILLTLAYCGDARESHEIPSVALFSPEGIFFAQNAFG